MPRRCKRAGVVVVDASCLGELFGDLHFCVAENDAGLPLALGLRLLGHRIFKRLRNANVANLDGLHGDSPRGGLLVEDLLQLVAECLALGDHLGELMAADGFAKGGLRAEGDSLGEVLDLEDGLFRVPDEPEDDGVDVDGHGVAGEGGFGADGCDTDALIDVAAQCLDHGNDEEEAGTPQSAVATEAQHGDLLPLVDDLDGEEKVGANSGSREESDGRVGET